METVKLYAQYAWRRLSDPDYMLGWIIVILILLLFVIVHMRISPRYLERAMARKLERQKVSDIVSASLQDAAGRGEITPEQHLKYNKKLGKALDLPDMIPRRKFDLNKARILCEQRLYLAGIDVVSKLQEMRRSRPSKKERALKAIRNKS